MDDIKRTLIKQKHDYIRKEVYAEDKQKYITLIDELEIKISDIVKRELEEYKNGIKNKSERAVDIY